MISVQTFVVFCSEVLSALLEFDVFILVPKRTQTLYWMTVF